MSGDQPGSQHGEVSMLPTPEEAAAEQRGVVFYRVRKSHLSLADTLGAVIAIVNMATRQGPGRHTPEGQTYGFRFGLRVNDDIYWVGFNHLAFGAMFEQALRAAGVKPHRAYQLPGGDPNKQLGVVTAEMLQTRRDKMLAEAAGKPAGNKAIMASAREQLMGKDGPLGFLVPRLGKKRQGGKSTEK